MPTTPDVYEVYLTSYKLYLQALSALRQEFWEEARAAPKEGRKSYTFVKLGGSTPVRTQVDSTTYTVAVKGSGNSRDFPTGAYLQKYGTHPTAGLPVFSDKPNENLCYEHAEEAQGMLEEILDYLDTYFRQYREQRVKLHVVPVTTTSFVESEEGGLFRLGVRPLYKDGVRVRYGGPRPGGQKPKDTTEPGPTQVAARKARKAAARRRQRAAKRARERQAKAQSLAGATAVQMAKAELAKATGAAEDAQWRLVTSRSKRAKARARRKARMAAASAAAGPSQSPGAQSSGRSPNRKERRRAIYGPPAASGSA